MGGGPPFFFFSYKTFWRKIWIFSDTQESAESCHYKRNSANKRTIDAFIFKKRSLGFQPYFYCLCHLRYICTSPLANDFHSILDWILSDSCIFRCLSSSFPHTFNALVLPDSILDVFPEKLLKGLLILQSMITELKSSEASNGVIHHWSCISQSCQGFLQMSVFSILFQRKFLNYFNFSFLHLTVFDSGWMLMTNE
jgi:hypothetical protein